MPICATWQRRQAGSSCPLAWECGATCSRKNRETSASATATDVASRRFGRNRATCLGLPVSKHYPRGLDATAGKRVPINSYLKLDAGQGLNGCLCLGGTQPNPAGKEGWEARDYLEKASALSANKETRLATIWSQILRTSSSDGFLSSSYFASGMYAFRVMMGPNWLLGDCTGAS